MGTDTARDGTSSHSAAQDLLWIGGAAALAFVVTHVFSGWLALRRNVFLVPYLGLSAAFLEGYRRRSHLSIRALIADRWIAGVLGALAAGVIAVWVILIQPPSPAPGGLELLGALLWLGLAYGVVDAALISVLPALATRRAFAALGWTGTGPRRLGCSLVSLLASVAVNVAYHSGYREFPGAMLLGPLVGNTVMTLAYVVTGNPLAAVLPHVAMHVAAVLHAVDTARQLPPHA